MNESSVVNPTHPINTSTSNETIPTANASKVGPIEVAIEIDPDTEMDQQPPVGPSIHTIPIGSRALISSDQLLTNSTSFVRELLENAIDSGATNIQLAIGHDAAGGVESIEVRDNGGGIARDDRSKIARPHSTSKIREFEEIVAAVANNATSAISPSATNSMKGISSFGFRGEALYCISNSCGFMSIQSKRANDPVAWRVTWVHGVRKESDENVAQAGSGTTIKIKELFHNRPIRAAMIIKEAKQEVKQLEELLRSYAFVHPHIRFKCDKPEFIKPNAPASPTLAITASSSDSANNSALALFREAIPLVIGASAFKQMMEFTSSSDGFRVEGFITRHDVESMSKELLRDKMDRIFVYITPTRSISLPWLSKALVQEWRAISTQQLQRGRHRALGVDPTTLTSGAYKIDPSIEGMLTGRFPLALVRISVPSPASLLDLNRSPDKRDILIGEEEVFKRHVLAAMKDGLRAAMDKIEIQQQEQWRQTHPLPKPLREEEKSNGTSTTASPRANGIASNPVAPSAPSTTSDFVMKQESGPSPMDEDEIEIVPSPAAFKQSQPTSPNATTTTNTAASKARPNAKVDFSTFVRPLNQPQSFTTEPPPLLQNSTIMSVMPNSNQPRIPILSSLDVPSNNATTTPSPKKRARITKTDADRSPLSSTPSMHQTQISLVDVQNAEVIVAQRTIPIDGHALQQIQSQFTHLDSIIGPSSTASKKPQFIANLRQPDLNIIRLPDDPIESLLSGAAAAPPLPTLCSFSLLRGDECALTHHLLMTHAIPSVPLDAPIPIDDQFPELTAIERQQLVTDVLHAERLALEQGVPTGCLTFQQALQLCGFHLRTTSTSRIPSTPTSLELDQVPSDDQITIEDFLSTLRHIWQDSCYQRTHFLKVRHAPSSTTGVGSAAFDSPVAAFSPNTHWRVDGVRRHIQAQACQVAKERQVKFTSMTNDTTIISNAVTKLMDRLQLIAHQQSTSSSTSSDWTQLACPHQQPITVSLTNLPTAKLE